jgi:glutamate-ammonia-ligase adenylyltransferase
MPATASGRWTRSAIFTTRNRSGLLAQDLAGTLTVERLADHLSALADIILGATLSGGLGAHAQRRHDGAAAQLRDHCLRQARRQRARVRLRSRPRVPLRRCRRSAVDRYTRLAGRLVTWLTSATAAGRLYDTDLRLRPDGAKGVLSSSLAGFWRYQREQAWTWEHQALTRARFVAGDAKLGAAFEAGRTTILCLPRDRDALSREVIDMRRRMLAGHPNPTPLFDLKHDAGGMVDVEFAVQYLILAHAHDHAEAHPECGNIALLGIAGELGLVPKQIAADTADAYRQYRRLQHKIRLTGAPHARIDPGAQAQRRAA